jgi:hypothetical protein
MFVRVVRFTGVDAERIEQLTSRVSASEGPPEGVPATGIQFLVDEEQGTAVVLQFFDSLDDLEQGEQVLSEMPSDQTPGTRASVDRCELKLELPPRG